MTPKLNDGHMLYTVPLIAEINMADVIEVFKEGEAGRLSSIRH
jgi:hypothetical protein